MAVYTTNPGNIGVTVKVTYQDVAGAYGGWFLVQAFVDGATTGTPPSSGAYTTFGYGGAKRAEFLAIVIPKLNALLGVGHSATWDANIVESVTPAVIDDNW